MNYALIGCGRIATNHIKAAVNNKLNIVIVKNVFNSTTNKVKILMAYKTRNHSYNRNIASLW